MSVTGRDINVLTKIINALIEHVSCLECCSYYVAPTTAPCGHMTLCRRCWYGRRKCLTCASPVERKNLKLDLPLQTRTEEVKRLVDKIEKLLNVKVDELNYVSYSRAQGDSNENVENRPATAQNNFPASVSSQASQDSDPPVDYLTTRAQIHSNNVKRKSPIKVACVPIDQNDWDIIEVCEEAQKSKRKEKPSPKRIHKGTQTHDEANTPKNFSETAASTNTIEFVYTNNKKDIASNDDIEISMKIGNTNVWIKKKNNDVQVKLKANQGTQDADMDENEADVIECMEDSEVNNLRKNQSELTSEKNQPNENVPENMDLMNDNNIFVGESSNASRNFVPSQKKNRKRKFIEIEGECLNTSDNSPQNRRVRICSEENNLNIMLENSTPHTNSKRIRDKRYKNDQKCTQAVEPALETNGGNADCLELGSQENDHSGKSVGERIPQKNAAIPIVGQMEKMDSCITKQVHRRVLSMTDSVSDGTEMAEENPAMEEDRPISLSKILNWFCVQTSFNPSDE